MSEAVAEEPKVQAPKKAPSRPAAPKKRKPMLLIILVAAGVLAAAGAVTAFLLLRHPSAPAAKATAEPAAEAKGEKPGLVSMQPFVVNLNEPAGDRYMKVTIQIAIVPASLAEELDKDGLFMAKVRDRILTLLSSKTYKEVGSPVGKESLRREIQARLGPLFEGGRIQDILFSDFVVQ